MALVNNMNGVFSINFCSGNLNHSKEICVNNIKFAISTLSGSSREHVIKTNAYVGEIQIITHLVQEAKRQKKGQH